jgi:hypothetical protein
MNNFFDNLLRTSSSATPPPPSNAATSTAKSPPVDGALAGQTLLNLLKQGQAPDLLTEGDGTAVEEESEANKQLKAMMYNNSMPRLLNRTSSKPSQIHDMLEVSDREPSPVKNS